MYIVEKGIKQLESRKLKLMEDIYDLQKQYDKQRKLNQDIIDPHVKVEIANKNENLMNQSHHDGFRR